MTPENICCRRSGPQSLIKSRTSRALLFLPDVVLHLPDRIAENSEVIPDEIGQVVLIAPGVEAGLLVLPACIPDRPGNGHVLEEPVVQFRDIPVEEGPGTPAVPVMKRVDPGKKEVEDDPLHNGMDEYLLFTVDEQAEFVDKTRDLFIRRGSEKDRP